MTTSSNLVFSAYSPLLEAYAIRPGVEQKGPLYNAVVLGDGSIVTLSRILEGERLNAILLSDGHKQIITTTAYNLTDKLSLLAHKVDTDVGFDAAKPTVMQGVVCLQKQGPIQIPLKAQINTYKNVLKYSPAYSSKKADARRRKKIPYGSAIVSYDREKFYGFVLDEFEKDTYNISLFFEALA